MAKDESGKFKGDVNIQADKDVHYKIMKRVMYSCLTAGYNNINFATQTAASSKGEQQASTRGL